MKKKGSTVKYTGHRNAALIDTYRGCLAAAKHINAADIARRVADSPAPRFWVSTERAWAVVLALKAGRNVLDGMLPTKREMFMEIYNRYLAARAASPNESTLQLVFSIVNSPAPRFYMTPASVKVIINRIKNGYYSNRK